MPNLWNVDISFNRRDTSIIWTHSGGSMVSTIEGSTVTFVYAHIEYMSRWVGMKCLTRVYRSLWYWLLSASTCTHILFLSVALLLYIWIVPTETYRTICQWCCFEQEHFQVFNFKSTLEMRNTIPQLLIPSITTLWMCAFEHTTAITHLLICDSPCRRVGVGWISVNTEICATAAKG